MKHFEYRPRHLLEFSYGGLDRHIVIKRRKISLQTEQRIQTVRRFARTFLFNCVECSISKLIRQNKSRVALTRDCYFFFFSVLRNAHLRAVNLVFPETQCQ